MDSGQEERLEKKVGGRLPRVLLYIGDTGMCPEGTGGTGGLHAQYMEDSLEEGTKVANQ